MSQVITTTIDKKKNTITIILPMGKEVSGSGKSMVIASTRGNLVTDQIVDGKPLVIGVNAYIKN